MSWRRVMFAVASPEAIDSGALHKAVRLASVLNARLELFRCIFEPRVVRPARLGLRVVEGDIRDTVESARGDLETIAERLRKQGVAVRTAVRWDYPPYEGIIRQALRERADLLVVQSTRRGRGSRLLLTHTDYRLIENCPCPLLLVKTQRPYLDVRVVAAVDPLHAHDKPAALDESIVEGADALSQALNGKLHIYHACPRWPDVARQSPELRHLDKNVEADVRARYREASKVRIAGIAARGKVTRGHVHIEKGDVARSLPRFAASIGADIVAMGAVARSLPQRAVIGHTAERVLDALDSDVLVVKPPGFRSPVARQSVHRLPKRHAQHARYVL